MATQPGQSINQAIANASNGSWGAQYDLHGAKAPGHMIVSHLIALVGDDASEIVHVEVDMGTSRRLAELTIGLVVFTRSLLVMIDLEAGGEPKTRVYPRSALRGLTVLSVPVVTMQSSGSGWEPWKIELSYPDNEISLPFDDDVSSQSDSVGRMLPSLIADLAEGSSTADISR